MKEIILLFKYAKERLTDARQCIIELIPCQAKRTDDNKGLYIKKVYYNNEDYSKIMKIKDKYDLKIEY